MADRTMVCPNLLQRPQFPALLARQGFLCNLTFDELESMGKSLNSMNLDELLRNIIWAEDSQLVQIPSSSTSSASFFLGNLNLNEALSKKTVGEVWKDIVGPIHQNLTLGKTTVEEFLVLAGVINLPPTMEIDPMGMASQSADSLQFQMAALPQEQPATAVLDSNFDFSEPVFENQLGIAMLMPQMSLPSSGSVAAADRKRKCSNEMMEKTIERRQKRMIKNRESAARSRAKKQAYTNQLEREVLELRQTIRLLQKEKILSPVHEAVYKMPKTTVQLKHSP